MATEFTWSTVSSTLTDKLEHPVKDFLSECGIDVSQFPRLRLLVEVQESVHRNTQVYIPLRVPGRPGVIFETYCRVVRLTEIPKTHEKGHRQFVELEWLIEEHPLLEAEHHAVFSFLSGEVECPSCRELFNPEPSILDDKSVKVTCNNCLHYWTIKVDSPLLNGPKLKLITDVFYKEPSKIQKNLSEWSLSTESRSDALYKQFFPVEIDSFEVDGPLEFLFGNRKSYRVRSGELDQDFEILSKVLINLLAFNYFKQPNEVSYSSKLDKTDICRKSEVEFKEEQRKKLHSEFFPTREFETIKTKPGETPFDGLHFGDTMVKEMKWDAPRHNSTASRSKAPLFIALGASFVLMSGMTAYFWMTRSEKLDNPQAVSRSIEQAEEASLTKSPELPKPVEASKTVPPAAPIIEDVPSQKMVSVEEKPIAPKVKQKTAELQKPEAPVVKTAVAPVAIVKEEKEVQVRPEEPVEGRNLARVALIDAGYRQGMLHLKLQQAKEAALEFERVIEMDPKHIESYRNLGLAYVYDRRFEDAISVFEKYLNLAGNSSDRSSVEELLETLKDRVHVSDAR